MVRVFTEQINDWLIDWLIERPPYLKSRKPEVVRAPQWHTTILLCQITSYGGHLRYTVNYVAGFNTRPTTYPDIEILVRCRFFTARRSTSAAHATALCASVCLSHVTSRAGSDCGGMDPWEPWEWGYPRHQRGVGGHSKNVLVICSDIQFLT